MEYFKKNVEDVAEDIVCRWYSNTRGMDIHKKGVILSLKALLTVRLVKQRVDPLVAERLAGETIVKWANECEGLPADNIYCMESLMVHVSNLIR